jgi:hypothetical protein
MSDSRNELTPEVRALLDREREVSPVSPAMRARALARARAAITAGSVAYAPRVARPPRLRWAVAAMVTFAAAAAVGAGAYQVRVHLAEQTHVAPAVKPIVAAAPSVPVTTPDPVAPAEVEPAEALPEARPAHAGPTTHASRADAVREELRLLWLARAAVARRDFAGALAPLSEHARRFRDGRLTEEREALRVRALAGLGRTDEARQAAQRFEARFPRSVLLPAVRQMSAR